MRVQRGLLLIALVIPVEALLRSTLLGVQQSQFPSPYRTRVPACSPFMNSDKDPERPSGTDTYESYRKRVAEARSRIEHEESAMRDAEVSLNNAFGQQMQTLLG